MLCRVGPLRSLLSELGYLALEAFRGLGTCGSRYSRCMFHNILAHFGGFSFVLTLLISAVSSLLVPPRLVESFRTVPGSFVVSRIVHF